MSDWSATSRVAAELREQILTGVILPGTPLSQVRLATAFDVSRIPVRDALQTLAAEGLVVHTSGATAVVTGMSMGELQELYEMREAIEPVATQLAVPNVGRAEILSMRRLLAVMGETTDAREWLTANADFHSAVYMQANRPRMVALVEQLRKLTDRYLHLHLEVIGNTDHLHDEHTQILQAVQDGDAPLAARLTQQHLQTSHDFILEYLLEHQLADGVAAEPAVHPRPDTSG